MKDTINYLNHTSTRLAAKNIAILFFGLLLGIIAGFQVIHSSDTHDYQIYKYHYENISFDPLDTDAQIQFELFYNILTAFGKLIFSLDYEVYASLIAAISLSIKFYIFFRRKHGLALALGYLLTLYPYYECLRLRGALAVSLIFLAFELRNHRWTSLVTALAGVSIHYSVLPLFCVWLVVPEIITKERKKLFLILALLVTIGTTGVYLMADVGYELIYLRLEPYFNGNNLYINIWVLPKLMILVVMIFFISKQLKVTEARERVLPLFLGACIYFILSILSFDKNILMVQFIDICVFTVYITATLSISRYSKLLLILLYSLIALDVATKTLEISKLFIYILK